MLLLQNATHAEWSWRRTLDGGVEPLDEAMLVRNLDCPSKLVPPPAGSPGVQTSGTAGSAGSAAAAGVLALAAAAAAAAALRVEDE